MLKWLQSLVSGAEKTIEDIISPVTTIIKELEDHAKAKIAQADEAIKRISDLQVAKAKAEQDLADAQALGDSFKKLVGRA